MVPPPPRGAWPAWATLEGKVRGPTLDGERCLGGLPVSRAHLLLKGKLRGVHDDGVGHHSQAPSFSRAPQRGGMGRKEPGCDVGKEEDNHDVDCGSGEVLENGISHLNNGGGRKEGRKRKSKIWRTKYSILSLNVVIKKLNLK